MGNKSGGVYVLSNDVQQAGKNNDESSEPEGANWLSITGPLSVPLTSSGQCTVSVLEMPTVLNLFQTQAVSVDS